MDTTHDPVLPDACDRFQKLSQHVREAHRLYAIWAVAARDQPLLDRLGKSFTTAAFIDVRSVLHGHIVLTLARIWDDPSGRFADDTLSIPRLVRDLSGMNDVIVQGRLKGRDPRPLIDSDLSDAVRDAIAAMDAAEKPGIVQGVEREIAELEAICAGARTKPSFANLRTLRNKRIAHYDLNEIPEAKVAKIGDEREWLELSEDVVQRIGGLVNIDPNFETMKRSAAMAATLFWRDLRAESVEERNAARPTD